MNFFWSSVDGESSNLHLPVDSSSVNPSFLSQYFPSSQYPVIEKLLLDVISLFSVSQIPSIDGQKASSFPHDPIQSLHQYFESNEFLELVSDTLNIFLLHSIPNYHVPSHRTAIELCFYHLKQMNSLPNDKIKSTSTSWKYCAPGGKDDLDYNLYPVTWSASKKSKKFLGKNSQSEKLRKRCSR